jgi:hypothetical protein
MSLINGHQTSSSSVAPKWVSGVVYGVDAMVVHGVSLYQCLIQHTSGTFATDLSGLNWTLISAAGAFDPVANHVTLIGPTTGGPLVPTWRALQASDIPSLSATYLPLAGGTMSGSIDMGSTKITSVANGTNSGDAVNFGQLSALQNGLVWKNPIIEPNVFDDSLSAPPGSPNSQDIYLVGASPTGLWAGLAGHLVSSPDNGTSWQDHSLGLAPILVGDRFGICMESGHTPTCAHFTSGGSKKYYIATVTNATPGSYAYTFEAPQASEAVFCNNPQSFHFGHSYTYEAVAANWVEFAGPGAIAVGDGLQWNGNTINLKLDGSSLSKSATGLKLASSFVYDAGSSTTAKAISFSNGVTQKVLMSGAGTCTFTFSNPTAGDMYFLELTQPASSPTTVYAWAGGTFKWASGTAPTPSGVNKVDLISFYYDGTTYFGSASLNY